MSTCTYNNSSDIYDNLSVQNKNGSSVQINKSNSNYKTNKTPWVEILVTLLKTGT